VSLIWGVAAMLGGFAGNRDLLSPLPLGIGGASVSGATKATAEAHLFERVANIEELDRRFADAKRAGKPVLLDYFATWCTDCIRMEKATFNQARVQEEMKRFVLLQADVTDPNDPLTKAVKARYGVFGPPAMLFFDKDGNERRDLRTYGFKGPDDFIALLRKI
jgi:thiol:disulfide interchange protein DsbD